MKIINTLKNPFALVVQGFVAGAIAIFATMTSESDPRQPAPSPQAATLHEIEPA